MAPILLGVYLFVKALQERAAGTAADGPPTDGLDTDSSSLL